MSRLRFNWAEAVAHLASNCRDLAMFIDIFGKARMRQSDSSDVFAALARAIAYQQLSGKAAGTIHGRFEQLFTDGRPTALETVELSFDQLRSVGLSRAKTLSIQDLAGKCLSGTVPSRRQLGRLNDDQVIGSLCQVRGIGPWTAQMYLMFDMGRPDIMPAADLGVQKGVRAVYRLEQLPGPEEVMERTRHLKPFRTAASWYFWRASEPVNWEK